MWRFGSGRALDWLGIGWCRLVATTEEENALYNGSYTPQKELILIFNSMQYDDQTLSSRQLQPLFLLPLFLPGLGAA